MTAKFNWDIVEWKKNKFIPFADYSGIQEKCFVKFTEK